MSRTWTGAGALLLVCLLGYANSLSGSFHYDDFHSIVDNPHIRTLRNAPAFFIDPLMFSGDPDKKMYRPLVLLSYAGNYALGGYEVRGYHLVNILLHLGCSLLVWRLGLRLCGSGLLARCRGSAVVAQPLLHHRQIPPGQAIAGIQLHGSGKGLAGGGQVLEREVGAAQVHPGARVRLVQFQGALMQG